MLPSGANKLCTSSAGVYRQSRLDSKPGSVLVDCLSVCIGIKDLCWFPIRQVIHSLTFIIQITSDQYLV